MAADAHGTPGEARPAWEDLPVSGTQRIPAQRSGPDLVAPLTIGRPRWRRRYTHAALAVYAGALACAPALYLLWRGLATLPLVAVMLSVVALVALGRGALLAWLHHLRRHGRATSSILAVGTVDDVAKLAARTRGAPTLGWRVGAACTSTGSGADGADAIAGVPVIGDLDGIAPLALTDHFDAVAVGPAPGWTAVRLQQLAWDLDCSRTALLVDPRLVQLVGPRMRVTGIPGLRLLRLDHPTLTRTPRMVKGAIDRIGALLALVLVAPVLLSCALAIRRDGGPALRRQVRLGRGGREFMLLTFRTTGPAGTLTPVGRVLRRYSLDEIPQLLNVLGGSLSLVGPRPPTPHENTSEPGTRRGLLVKPGLTGLWQVDDGSDDEAGGQDLLYVERWSPALDAQILLRTVRAAWHRDSISSR